MTKWQKKQCMEEKQQMQEKFKIKKFLDYCWKNIYKRKRQKRLEKIQEVLKLLSINKFVNKSD